ncbi:hypothetical protein PoB_006110500 [Plakobranchus ocellatus]|uniref:Uncharacterized protein n=1 Tax=Plakobranchus ocellatus TaxID=259542 RepID=A0AAV4CRZ1_9GAST|nr:hypothetical protein PoB_006110500 [Plakobranchus ocellatus]
MRYPTPYDFLKKTYRHRNQCREYFEDAFPIAYRLNLLELQSRGDKRLATRSPGGGNRVEKKLCQYSFVIPGSSGKLLMSACLFVYASRPSVVLCLNVIFVVLDGLWFLMLSSML